MKRRGYDNDMAARRDVPVDVGTDEQLVVLLASAYRDPAKSCRKQMKITHGAMG